MVRSSPVAQTAKRLPAMWETRVQSLGREDLLEKEMAPHSSTLAWRIPWTTVVGYCLWGRKESDTTERPHLASELTPQALKKVTDQPNSRALGWQNLGSPHLQLHSCRRQHLIVPKPTSSETSCCIFTVNRKGSAETLRRRCPSLSAKRLRVSFTNVTNTVF